MTSVETKPLAVGSVVSRVRGGDGLTCWTCESPGLVYPRRLNDDQPVACGRCGVFVSTYGELKRRTENALASVPEYGPLSGC